MNKYQIHSLAIQVETRCAPFCICQNLGIHGIPHLRRVSFIAGRIANFYGENVESAVVAGFLHDCARTDDGGGKRHAYDSAVLAKRVLAQFYPHLDSARICKCIELHTDGKITTDRLLGSVWDADRLDLSRLGYKIIPELLSTDTARRLAALCFLG